MNLKINFIKFLFFYGFIFFIIPAVQAQTVSDNLADNLKNIKSFQADFSQTVKDKNGNILQQSQGKMALKRPGLFRWETQTPNRQLIIADGKNIWIDDKDLDQITHQPQNRSENTPGLLLSDSVGHLISGFHITLQNQDQHQDSFKLIPKKNTQKNLFKSVELVFDQHHKLIKMILNDNLGQTTQIIFTHSQVNLFLPPALFQFHPSEK